MSQESSLEIFNKFAAGRVRVVSETIPVDDAIFANDPPVAPARDLSDIGVGAYELLSSRKVTLDERMARWLVGATPVPGERHIRPAHVDYLVQTMERGTYRPEIVSLAMCEVQDIADAVRLNGHHTARAILKYDNPGFAPTVTLHLYRAATMEGARSLYAQYDRGTPRTKANVVDAYLADLEPFSEWGSDVRSRLAAAVALYKWSAVHERTRNDGDALVSIMTTEMLPHCKHAAALLRGGDTSRTRHMRRSSVVAAMFGTYAMAPTASTTFWTVVRDGIGVTSVTDPRAKLRDMLLSTSVGSANGTRKQNERVAQEQMYRNCIQAWNAYREGRQMKRFGSTTERPKFV